MQISDMRDIQVTVLVILGVISVGVAFAAETRSGRRIGSPPSGFKSPCGTADEVSKRGGQCLESIFELVDGRFPFPRGDSDLTSNCNRFNVSSRCIRLMAKDCLSGVHKTAVGALATATRRFHSVECKTTDSRAPYMAPLVCAHQHGTELRKLYQTQTGIIQGIRDLPITAEEKIIKVCCVLNDIDNEVSNIFNKYCPKSQSLVIKMIHGVTDDARNTLCLSPKCKGALDGVKNNKYTPPQNLMEPIQQILYQLSV